MPYQLSVIIPTLNEENYIGKLLNCLKHQTFKDFEVIIVDGNSEDKTKEVVKGFMKDFKSLKFVTHKARNVSAQRNYGASTARSNLLLFFDADIMPERDFLLKTLNEFKRRRLDVATCYITPLSRLFADKVSHGIVNLFMLVMQYINPKAPGFCLFSKKDVHNKINGFDPSIRIAEDWDYVQRASRVARFRVLVSRKIPVSVRRFDKEGRFKLFIKYPAIQLYRLLFGEVRTDRFIYLFGRYNKKSGK